MAVHAIVDTIVSFVREHEGWAVPIAFLVAFGESFCFLSLLWPGTAILASVAALLAASGVPQTVVMPAIVSAGLGGSLGYAASYWIGLYFKDSVHKIWPFSARPNLIPRGQKFFASYGAFGVFVGHFFGPIRAVIPVVAGMFEMRQLPFQVANITSAFIWAAGIVAPAFFLVEFKDDVFAFLREHETLVALAMFLLAIANSIPHPLLFVPTLILFIGLGALQLFAGGDFLPLWLAGAAGALAGDLFSYWSGERNKADLAGAWHLNVDVEPLDGARALIRRWGVPAVIVSKFLGRNRDLVPLVAGAMAMPPVDFVLASALSALLWSGVLLLPAIAIKLLAP
ncbi:MAG TPA: VTT domain-containing protein [Hyphomicrobiaceae bacterium]|nr:VTT domain-containing protein [Hyphomicrobiaceae bacterium]